MRRKIIFALLFVCAVGVAAFFLTAPGQHVQAQQNCPSFDALLQDQLLNFELLLRPGDVWGGYVHGYLGQEPLHGRMSGNDGNEVFRAHMGMGTGGSYFFDFGGGNTFTTFVTQATFPNPPGHFGIARYNGAQKITEGTGRFQYASGNLLVMGPAVVWDLDKELPQGRWNAEVTGNICGVE